MLPFIVGVAIGIALTSSKLYKKEYVKIVKQRKAAIKAEKLNPMIVIEGWVYDPKAKDYYMDSFEVPKVDVVLFSETVVLFEERIFHQVRVAANRRPIFVTREMYNLIKYKTQK